MNQGPFTTLVSCIYVITLSAFFAGVVNMVINWQQIEKRCSFLPFFSPYKSLSGIAWIVIQILLPGVAFLYYIDLLKPLSTTGMLTLGIVFGVFFSAIVNYSFPIGISSRPIKTIQELITSLIFTWIAASETENATQYYTDLRQELLDIPDLQNGILWISNTIITRSRIQQVGAENALRELTQIDKLVNHAAKTIGRPTALVALREDSGKVHKWIS